MLNYHLAAAVVESVDTGDLKSPGSDTVRVRVPSAAPKIRIPVRVSGFLVMAGTRIIQSQYAGGILLPPVQKLVATSIFAPCGAKMQTSPVSGGEARKPSGYPDFWLPQGLEQSKPPCRGQGGGEGLTEPNLYFCPLGRNANESRRRHCSR